jgi:hypothetical protein
VTSSHCTANICQEQPFPSGGPIERGCDGFCAAIVCANDSFCCEQRWDSICVGRVATDCGLTCP